MRGGNRQRRTNENTGENLKGHNLVIRNLGLRDVCGSKHISAPAAVLRGGGRTPASGSGWELVQW